MIAISISNSSDLILQKYNNELWKERESLYINTINKYELKEKELLYEAFGRLVVLFEDEIKDYLGEIYMKTEMGNKHTGQFFTPFHLSEFTSRITIDIDKLKNSNEKIYLNEPSTGGGGMMLAAIKTLKENGIDYINRLEIEAQDLDYRGVYMTYIQLSLLGVSAIVKQGDTLSTEKITEDRIFCTPRNKGILI